MTRSGRTPCACHHVSWLDILVLGGATGCAFVSKDNLGHGFIHWLADQNQTLYIHRGRRSATADQATAIATKLELPQPLALFPEGTTGPGDLLLPFRSSLLDAVAPAPSGVEVRPWPRLWVRRAHRRWYTRVARKIFARPPQGDLPTVVHSLPPLERIEDRSTWPTTHERRSWPRWPLQVPRRLAYSPRRT